MINLRNNYIYLRNNYIYKYLILCKEVSVSGPELITGYFHLDVECSVFGHNCWYHATLFKFYFNLATRGKSQHSFSRIGILLAFGQVASK